MLRMLRMGFGGRNKSFQVRVEPFGKTLTVGARETILQAALRAGLAYPSECRAGACASCKTQLVDGKIKPLTDFAYVLDVEEVQNGTFLACQSLAKTNLTIRVETLDDGLALIKPKSFRGEISSINYLTRDIQEVIVNLDSSLDYYAGQYANLTFPGVADSRSYSFSSAPVSGSNTTVKFHIRIIPNGEVSEWVSAGECVGKTIQVEGPFGVFRMRDSLSPIVCIAGGSGMAPILSILEQGMLSKVDRPVVYLYGARTRADLYNELLVDDITKGWSSSFRFLPVLSAESEESSWEGARGLVTDYISQIEDFDLQGAQAYLCGPPAMIDAAIPVLNNCGVRGRDIFYDKFTDRSDRTYASS
jgi:NAD(P)H-flavin reductase/ferredoxin